jgi:hypothetical protein
MHWISDLDLSGVDYLGVDIVPDVIADNSLRHARPGVRLQRADLTCWTPPPADLIIVRDLLIRLTNDQTIACLRDVAASGARLLLVSNYAGVRRNGDTFTGGLRAA